MSVRRLLLFAFGPLVVLVAVLLALGIGAISVAGSSVDELVSRVQPLQRANAELRATMLDASRGLRGYTYNGDVGFREAYDRGQQSHSRIQNEVTRLAKGAEQQSARRVSDLVDRWFALTMPVRSTPPPSAADTARLLADSSLVMDEFLNAGTEFEETLDVTSASLRESSAATRRQAQLVLVTCAIFAVASAGGSALAMAGRLRRSITGLRDTVTRWAAGDRDARVPEQGIAEMRDVARSINGLVDEATRLHAAELERERLRDIAAAIGVRIRESLDVDEVVRVATAEIRKHFTVEDVYVRLGGDTALEPAAEVLPFETGALVVLPVEPLRPEELEALQHVVADLARGIGQAQLYQEQQALVRELRALDRSKSEFVSNVSHELRTPMTSIAGYVEMLREGDGGRLTRQQHKMLEIVHRNAQRLRRLIEELLLLAKLESGAMLMTEEPVDVGSLIEDVVDTLRPAADGNGVRLDRENEDELVVMGDAVHLDRVVSNLVSNAVKFTPKGGEVHVTSRRCDDGWVEVEVQDTGIGIPEADQQAVFSRFHRAANATEQAIAGSGLGLAIVRQIVQRHGGQVVLASMEGEGTTATVRLPAARTGDEA